MILNKRDKIIKFVRDECIDDNVFFIGHHGSHLASLFNPSPFNEAREYIIGGDSEWTTIFSSCPANN